MATLATPRIPRRQVAELFRGLVQPMSFRRASGLTVDTGSVGIGVNPIFPALSFRHAFLLPMLLLRPWEDPKSMNRLVRWAREKLV